MTLSTTCPDCGYTLTSQYRTPSLGTHRGSKVCRERALQKEMEDTGRGRVPRVWRWILNPIGVKVEESPESDEHVYVPAWVSEVVATARSATSSYTWEKALDAAASRAVKFIKACQKDMQLVEALAAANKLGGRKAAVTFMDDHITYVNAFRGTK